MRPKPSYFPFHTRSGVLVLNLKNGFDSGWNRAPPASARPRSTILEIETEKLKS